MVQLEKILKGCDVVSIRGNQAAVVESVSFDSRSTSAGDLFVAVRGTGSDGHKFIGTAIKAGAVAVICEELPPSVDDAVCWVVVRNSAVALAIVAANYYGRPSEKIKLVGVTGTNGKTTVATLLYNLFMSLGYPSGLLSTVANYINGREIAATHTTPDPVQLNRLLAGMVESGCEFAFMEVSSHALVQHRTAGLKFSGALFTNITHDHLDYHKTFSNYIAAKKSFFDSLPADSFAIINVDDRNGRVMVQNCRAAIHSYSLRTMADFMAKIIENRFEGMLLRIENQDVSTRFIGEFNAYNLLLVYAAAKSLGASTIETLVAISKLYPVQGRLEVIRSPRGITGIVDYAHTPDAIENVISTLNAIREPGINLITVVGAGGDRDKTKRPEMARIAVKGSDKVILTSDNPRSEEPEKILEEMMAGVDPSGRRKVVKITDRREAIRTAVMMAGNDDIILIAGKGHETYQEIKGVRSHFDDREEFRKASGTDQK